MTDEFILPPALEEDDKIAVVGSGNGPAKETFPEAYSLGLKRLEEVFNLEPVEFSTAKMNATERSNNVGTRALEINESFQHDDIKGVLATVGGNDQIKILEHLDPEVLRNNPTRFYGYSDNTTLGSYLWNLNVVSFQGPMLMNELAMPYEMHDYTLQYCEKAFFEDSIEDVKAPQEFLDGKINRTDLEIKPEKFQKHPGFEWHNFDGVVQGRIWGGNLNTLQLHLQANKPLPDKRKLEDKILAIEVSGTPPHFQIGNFLTGLGERGLLQNFSGIIIALPKATASWKENTRKERKEYRKYQKQRIKNKVKEYSPNLPVLFEFSFGHINPNLPLPIGGKAKLNPENESISLTFKN